jgi:hypothetical protein
MTIETVREFYGYHDTAKVDEGESFTCDVGGSFYEEPGTNVNIYIRSKRGAPLRVLQVCDKCHAQV